MKKLLKFLAILFAVCVFTCAISCNQTQESQPSSSNSGLAKSLVKVVDNKVVILVDDDYMQIKDTTVLVDYMHALKADGALEFTMADGMVNSINGKENPADYSSCWMLYSNDGELTNQAWGSVKVDGVEYFSAVLGAERLPIKNGKTYVWEYKTF